MMLPGIQIQMMRAFEVVLGSEAAVDAVLHWRVVVGRPEDYDVNDESSLAGAALEISNASLGFRTLFHQVDHRLSGFQRYVEVQTGDVILDYLADLSLDGKEDVRVEVGGQMYVQKNASTALLEAWDVQMGSGGTLKTLLLTPAP